MSSISTLIDASSSAAVLLGFFIVQIPPGVLAHSRGSEPQASYLSTAACTRASADNLNSWSSSCSWQSTLQRIVLSLTICLWQWADLRLLFCRADRANA